jgi:hypothetical protein
MRTAKPLSLTGVMALMGSGVTGLTIGIAPKRR